jgi:hypothetical protein
LRTGAPAGRNTKKEARDRGGPFYCRRTIRTGVRERTGSTHFLNGMLKYKQKTAKLLYC